MNTITGCWECALITDDGKREARFALDQPSHTNATAGPVFSFDGTRADAQLLDGAARSFVALAYAPESAASTSSGNAVRLLLEARVFGDRLVGRWLRRDSEGRIVAGGSLTGARAA